MSTPDPDERQELLAARERLERQIELLRNPVAVGAAGSFTDNTALIAELAGVLREIEVRLDELDPGPITTQ